MDYILILIIGLLLVLASFTVRQKINKKEEVVSDLSIKAKECILEYAEKYEINYTPFGEAHGFCNFTKPCGTVHYVYAAKGGLGSTKKAEYMQSIPDALRTSSILKYLAFAINNDDIKVKHV
mgnify:CR=1 FL=1